MALSKHNSKRGVFENLEMVYPQMCDGRIFSRDLINFTPKVWRLGNIMTILNGTPVEAFS